MASVAELGQRLKVLSTPSFNREAGEHGLGIALRIKIARILARSQEPSWIIGDPTAPKKGQTEDEGRTLKLRAPFRFYAIRDDHEPECACGCDGSKVVTFLLPEEY